MKRIIVRGILIILIVAAILNVEEAFKSIDKNKIAQCIENYYESKGDKINIVSFKEIGSKRIGCFINEYEVVNLDTYIYEDDRLEGYSDQICPVKFKFISIFGYYKILWKTVPDEGELYPRSMERIFPIEIREKLDKKYSEYVDELKKSNKEKFKSLDLEK